MRQYYMPTKVFYGGTIDYSNIICGSKAFLVTGKTSAKKSGALDAITQTLTKEGIPFFHYDAIAENPTFTSVNEGSRLCKEAKCDFIIGIGGGSPIDAAKAIALQVANNLANDEILRTDLYKKALPIVAIPTTSGTGSEVTPYTVLTNEKTCIKAGVGSDLIFPRYAILNPEFTLSLPHNVTRDTAIDALSHLLEGIYSNKRSRLIYPLIFNGVRMIFENLPLALREPNNLQARTHLMRASTWGGIVIAQTSTTLQHSIGYPLTSKLGITHGLANGLVMQSIMDLCYSTLQEDLDELFSYVGITRSHFYEWLTSLDLAINTPLTNSFIENALPEVMASRNMANNPIEIELDDIRKIYLSL